ncbi:fused MFS/spermidine synthase [Tessaracoccus sp. OS52]|uniref:spermidine synthase n=1 Tax=Tessaracoccus sp. OS52 TaxID=2886691 RepID=UPI001D103298|nr:fused MFS/spermidine synthase [Tessaracoccus sp. OS52]MCC2591904.1 fused MFS/spermidine synthase [Tessaracoccus sp. OS52]
MPDRLVPDDTVPGAFAVRFGDTSQSWVDPARPDFLAFEYVQHTAMLLDHTILDAPAEQRLRVVHVGGAAMSLPRWVAWRRPGTAQIVCEPDVELTEEVRRKVPLPPRSGIKVRDVDGRTGVAAMPDEYADAVIVDAFDGSHVPGELVTAEAFDDVRRIGRGAELIICNVTDRAPFHWTKRVAAGIRQRWRHVIVGAESPVHKGKRFGNLLLAGSTARADLAGIRRESGKLPFGYRWLDGRELTSWIGDAEEFTDADTQPSPEPSGSKLWFS